MTKTPVMNIDAVEMSEQIHGSTFEMRGGRMAPALGLSKLGCRLVVIPPGKRGWPFHLHHVNEELFFILSGTGTLRFGEDEHPLRPGDVIGTPTGPGTAHQIVNSGSEDLRYLAVSTLQYPEIAEYPDSGKFNVMTGPMTGPGNRSFMHVGRRADEADYWDGED